MILADKHLQKICAEKVNKYESVGFAKSSRTITTTGPLPKQIKIISIPASLNDHFMKNNIVFRAISS